SISYLFSQIRDIQQELNLTKFVSEFDLEIVLLDQLTTKIE
ncbi:589_t:CDS:2, partial [Entrophospora sp. SA101]